MFFKIPKQPFRFGFPHKRNRHIVSPHCICCSPVRFIETCIGSGFVKIIYIQAILRGFILHDIMPFKKNPYFIGNPHRTVFPYYKQVYFQRFCIQVIFLFKYKPFSVFCKFQVHCRHKSRMPLYFCIFHGKLLCIG